MTKIIEIEHCWQCWHRNESTNKCYKPIVLLNEKGIEIPSNCHLPDKKEQSK